MKVFISWSGQKSRSVAELLREWLPNVIQSVDPFISSEDIDAGTTWFTSIKAELDKCSFGIVCLTKANREAPWLLYEAGALAHKVDRSNVIPLMIDLNPSDFGTPLSLFQGCTIEKDSFFRIVKAINDRAKDGGLSETRLQKGFETWWPQLEKDLNSVSKQDFADERKAVPEPDSETDRCSQIEHAVNEILSRVRTIGVKMEDLRLKPSEVKARNSYLDYLYDVQNPERDKVGYISLAEALSGDSSVASNAKTLGQMIKEIYAKEVVEESSSSKGGRKEDTSEDDQEGE